MILHLEYDRGQGPRTVQISIAAQYGWEVKTKQKIGALGSGIGMTDLVGLLFEQLRVQGENPLPATAEGLAGELLDLNPVTPPDPSQPGEEVSPG